MRNSKGASFNVMLQPCPSRPGTGEDWKVSGWHFREYGEVQLFISLFLRGFA